MKQQQPIVYGGQCWGPCLCCVYCQVSCKHFYNLITNSVSDSFVWSVLCLNLLRRGWIIFTILTIYDCLTTCNIVYLYRPGPRPASLITADCKVAFVNKTCNHLFLQEMSLVLETRDRLHEKWCSSSQSSARSVIIIMICQLSTHSHGPFCPRSECCWLLVFLVSPVPWLWSCVPVHIQYSV